VQDEISLIGNRAGLILGSKIEHNDKTGFEAGPTLRLHWSPGRRQTVWTAVSRAVRTPNEAEYGFGLRATPVSNDPSPVFPRIVGNPDMVSETMWAYELGYRAQATNNFSVDMALFYHHYIDLLISQTGDVEPGPEGTLTYPITLINGLDGEAYGAELAVTWQVARPWRLYAAYTFLKVDVWPRAPGLLPGVGRDKEEQSPGNQAYLQSSWDLPGNLELDVMGRYVESIRAFIPKDKTSLAKEGTVGAYITSDARLAWSPFKNLTLELVGQNLFHNHHREFGTNPFTKSELVEIERSLYGKVIWHF
jgi:iron complex outermembrane receptor protein